MSTPAAQPKDTASLPSPAVMTPAHLDLLVLTFNCAKNLIDVAVFAQHLRSALGQNATGLPDLVVISLQEIAPLSYCFIGGYFLTPYLARFEDAVNLAATQHVDDSRRDTDATDAPDAPAGPIKPYTLVRGNNVGYTGILLFARDPDRLRDIKEADVGFGAADMGNKGAVGLRMLYDGGKGASTELTFVATHLAAMEWNLPRRNANWAAIMRGMAFENPEKVVENFRRAHASGQRSSVPDHDDSEHIHLLHDQHHAQQMQLQQQLHDISVFRPSSHLFVAGDLNYRISATSPPPAATFPSLDPESPHYYPDFFRLDQLTRERNAGRTLHGLSEHEVRFPPTYKYDVLPQKTEPETEVPWQFAPHRYPSWTDRILFLDLPPWVKSQSSSPRLTVRAYDAFPVLRTSDHRPVFLRIHVPLIPPSILAPSPELRELETSTDPRVRLPVEMDPEAWERRAAARRKEVMAGWSLFLWSTKQGAWILATVLAAGLGAYWLYRGFAV